VTNNHASGSQPGTLPQTKRLTPINPVGGAVRFIDHREGGNPDHIIIHSTVANSLVGSSDTWLATNKYSGVSIHTLANRDGSLTEICPPSYLAFHAGHTLKGWENDRSLGIELENASGNARGDVEPYSPAQLNAAAYRVATWMFSYGIATGRVARHKDVAVYGPQDPKAGQLGRKQDPVGPFDWGDFMRRVDAWLLFFSYVPAVELPYWIEGKPLAAVAPKEYGFLGPATISAAVAERVLRAVNSPILQERPVQEYIDVGNGYGINFAVALAFSWHENKFGTAGPTVPLKNWGAVRTPELVSLASMPMMVGTSLGYFANYQTWFNALKDWCERIKGPKYLGTNPNWNVLDVLKKYAPTTDPLGTNNPEAYNADVQHQCRVWEAESSAA
jgi:N-acetyl-anhydromuramyl-L-alanine amidase AmpD